MRVLRCVLCGSCFPCRLVAHQVSSIRSVHSAHWTPSFSRSLILHSVAHKLYPIRVRLVNDLSSCVEWVTVAYVPIVRKLQEPGADERARIRRCGILQRVIYAAFTQAIGRSHIGFRVKVNGQKARAFPRVLLYLCDQPEERAVLGLKGGQCAHPCTSCMAKIEVVGAPEAVSAERRNVINTVNNQVEAYEHSRRQRRRQRRLALGAFDSTSGGVPALAGMAGLGTAPLLLYNMIGFDILHVREPLLLVTCDCDPSR